MTQPRRIVPGQCYMITRRVLLRTFLLRPSAFVNAAFEYCLAEASARFGIELMAWTAMSNHYHAVVCDPEGTLPEFLEHFHKMLAKVLNIHHGRRENFWSSEETCVTHLVTPEDVIDKIVYVLTNPAAANLVESIAFWPGASSWTRMGELPVTVQRPRKYFRKDGVMDEEVTLRAEPPPGAARRSRAAWVAKIREKVFAREEELRKERRKNNVPVVGAKEVRRTSEYTTPSTVEKRRKLRPCLACKDPQKMRDARAVLRGFRVAYRRMFELLCGVREKDKDKDTDKNTDERKGRLCTGKERLLQEHPKIEFPSGTYRLSVVFGVPCAAA